VPPEFSNAGVIRILIADDHAVVREGIRQVLSLHDDFEVIGETGSGSDAVALCRSLRPDVVVLDISMPDMSGLDAASQIRALGAAPAILILSIHDHAEYVRRGIEAGAQAYLRKDSSPRELRNAIRAVYEGGTFFSGPAARHLIDAAGGPGSDSMTRGDTLTPRERDVLVEIASGATNKEIAATLGLSVRTVESHRESLLKKLDARGTAGLTRFAIAAGLISP
jgi:DNA-binding NarL/FixJ family response regulator